MRITTILDAFGLPFTIHSRAASARSALSGFRLGLASGKPQQEMAMRRKVQAFHPPVPSLWGLPGWLCCDRRSLLLKPPISHDCWSRYLRPFILLLLWLLVCGSCTVLCDCPILCTLSSAHARLSVWTESLLSNLPKGRDDPVILQTCKFSHEVNWIAFT